MPIAHTPDLDIAYEEAGPKDGPVVLLLHGWPDDATTWAEVSPVLNAAGLHTITPTLRGFGQSRFTSASTSRTGNSGILAFDAIALMDALGVPDFSVAGHDWGSNAAEALATGWPGRVRKLCMLSTPSRLGGMPTPDFEQCQRQWYHWFLATKRGAKKVDEDRNGFAHLMWMNWSPAGWFEEATFQRVAKSFENPDWSKVTIHSYRSRWDEAEPDPKSAALEAKVKRTASLALPTLYVHGEVDGVNPPSTAKDMPAKFSGPFESLCIPGVGHFPTREAPDKVAEALVMHFA